jgi:serine-type D-Ala-D-Ala endopeptidase (penicillin-binding protein 7)
MTFRARALGSIALAALIALSATTADAATTKRRSKTTVHRTAVAKKKTTVRKKRRAARKPPAGGVYSRHAVVFDPVTNEVLFEKNAARTVPIASITKLMTALVFLDQDPDLSNTVEITRTEISGGGKTQLRRGEEVALGDLLHMSLMCSDNVATRALAKGAGISEEEFLSQMNRKALELGLTDTRFVEFTGLDERNVSTATDVARLLRAAADVDMIRSISTTRSYEFRTDRAPHYIGNTNRLLYSRYEILGGKTGFISEAGYCLVTWVRTGGRDLIAVVLGAPTNATRFADVVRLVQRTVTPTVASTN